MKKSVSYLAVLICMMMQSVSTYGNDIIIPAEQLPAAAKSFIQRTFPGQEISYAKMGTDFAKKTYEVCLDNGIEVEFDKCGTWDKVNCNYSAVPAHLVPAAIANYVKAQFTDVNVVKIDKDRSGYEVELSNSIELKFDRHGQLIKIDD